ncbi:3-phosphoshikimate 1-carboxyvinyltransferase [Myroides injenensis]|uniref:3-phosphoshikimate 1-carboxyvinyltransferase n=1 Tax=Myroides injenensis TaxID=1183151 RepID=UPI0002882F42|nr:3-phosphoshikimate 1-carboxyvinyltransferase [Myroides injenensis]
MKVFLSQSQLLDNKELVISGSKSESNRLLILQELFPELSISNLSDADDVRAMQQALSSDKDVIDIHHAGTTMRFLTAYYALCSERELILTGSSRMQERPIGVLVEALRQLDARITYVNKEGYPPLKIKGYHSQGGNIELPANISSQYITALLLIGTKLPMGIELNLIGNITSRPYIEMTLALLEKLGAYTSFVENRIIVRPLINVKQNLFVVESDWSSASYFYSLIALSPIGKVLKLKSYQKDSLQGDMKIVELYQKLGVETRFKEGSVIELEKVEKTVDSFNANLVETPDLAQTIAVTCFGLGIKCELTGLHTLKIKETDRLVALKEELEKLGAVIDITDSSLKIEKSTSINSGVSIDTYQDHRMALAFAPLALCTDLSINDAEVVTKSFIKFWSNLQEIGIQICEQ